MRTHVMCVRMMCVCVCMRKLNTPLRFKMVSIFFRKFSTSELLSGLDASKCEKKASASLDQPSSHNERILLIAAF